MHWCRIGWHLWSRWKNGEVREFPASNQIYFCGFRVCEKCGHIETAGAININDFLKEKT